LFEYQVEAFSVPLIVQLWDHHYFIKIIPFHYGEHAVRVFCSHQPSNVMIHNKTKAPRLSHYTQIPAFIELNILMMEISALSHLHKHINIHVKLADIVYTHT